MGEFKAYTHYGDWRGTASADEALPESVHGLLREMGLIHENEFLLSVSINHDEHDGGSFHISALVLEGVGEVGQVENYLATHADPIPVRGVKFEMSASQFLGLFKDFNVVLTWQDLKLEGRECSVKEQEPINAQN